MGWKEIVCAGLIVGSGVVACRESSSQAIAGPNPIKEPTVSSSKMEPTECRGNLPVYRIRWERWNVGNKGRKPDDLPRPTPDTEMPMAESDKDVLVDNFNQLTCGHTWILRPEIQNDTVVPCEEEIPIKTLVARLNNNSSRPIGTESLRDGLTIYRAKECPTKIVVTPTLRRLTPTPIRATIRKAA